MKRVLIGLLIFTLLFPLCACSEEEPEIQSPVNFYYRRKDVVFEGSVSVIAPEVREALGHENDLSYLLGLYLAGPSTKDMQNTFPYGTRLVSVTIKEERATITVTSHMANLKGIDLTIACACITQTVMELTDAKSVEVKASSATLNGLESIIMDKESLLLLDDSAMDPAN